MGTNKELRAWLAFLLVVCLVSPSAALGEGKSGKKYFKEGVKYESVEQWDLAAQQYALAVAQDPDNAEYRLRWLRAMQFAALMYVSRGDQFEAKGDYSSAYNAYAKALTYDPSNETARTKMTRMVDQQKARAGTGDPVSYNQRTGNLVPVSRQIQTPRTRPRGDAVQRIEFHEGSSLKLVINALARELNLNVMFDESVKETSKVAVSLNEVTPARALDMILMQNKLIFEQVDRRTIMLYADNPANRLRLEKLLVKTFYLNSVDLNDARTIIQSSMGQQRPISISKQLNALIVRATASELGVVQSIINSIDKNRGEVVLDVNIYDVFNSASLQIGNSLFASDSASKADPLNGAFGLDNLGGFGFERFRSGALFGLPATSLSLLQTKGYSKLLASTQIHALDGEQNQTVVGRSVPVKTGTTYPGTTTGTSSTTVDNIQYRDVGLVIDVTPTISNEGYVQVKMKLESSNVETSGEDSSLTPTFSKRSLTTISRVQDGVTAVVASIKQDNRGENRSTVPVIGMVPILGRFFSSPLNTNSRTDIVITITPHITRAAEINPEDHLAYLSGTPQAGLTLTVEDVVYRAQAEEAQERREVAQGSSTAPNEPAVDANAKLVTVSVSASETVQTAPAAPEIPFADRVNPASLNPGSNGQGPRATAAPVLPLNKSVQPVFYEGSKPAVTPPAPPPSAPPVQSKAQRAGQS